MGQFITVITLKVTLLSSRSDCRCPCTSPQFRTSSILLSLVTELAPNKSRATDLIFQFCSALTNHELQTFLTSVFKTVVCLSFRSVAGGTVQCTLHCWRYRFPFCLHLQCQVPRRSSKSKSRGKPIKFSPFYSSSVNKCRNSSQLQENNRTKHAQRTSRKLYLSMIFLCIDGENKVPVIQNLII
jgi:hypothetical protein